MPHNVPNKYLNIFGCHIFTRQISEYICKPEIAQIRILIIFEGNFIPIFKYSNSSLIEEIFEKGSLMLLLNKMLYLVIFMVFMVLWVLWFMV